MAPKMESPVQTQMPVGALNRALSIDNSDHTVTRKLKLALNFSTDETSLTKNDLSSVTSQSPLLLKQNSMHRSSSTPCLSPTASDLPKMDPKSPIVILTRLNLCPVSKQLLTEIQNAIRNGVDPIPINSGLGGAYYFRNCNYENVAIVKPNDEEPFAPNNPKGIIGKSLGQPGLKRSVRVGETGFREVAAYLLDHNNFANVPPTFLVKITHSVFSVNGSKENRGYNNENRVGVSKIASCQQFILHDFDASDHGTSSFTVSSVHRIGLLDIRIFNTDRHSGNLLVRKISNNPGKFGAKLELIPIDHGLCLPESLEDPYFEWIHWPQASVPFSQEELEFIANLDPVKDSEILRTELPMIREASIRVLVLSTVFLKEAASFGLCLAEIGEMMSRQFTGGDEQPSELEIVCIQARKIVTEKEMVLLSPQVDSLNENFTQFEIECEEENKALGIEIEKTNCFRPINKNKWDCNILKLSSSLNCGIRSGNWRSAEEQLHASANFVKLGDMSEETWGFFLEMFLELLPAVFRPRRSGSAGQRQRLGTSCKF